LEEVERGKPPRTADGVVPRVPEQRRTVGVVEVEGAVVTGIQEVPRHGPQRVEGECRDGGQAGS
jgi:hypothetical protein